VIIACVDSGERRADRRQDQHPAAAGQAAAEGAEWARCMNQGQKRQGSRRAGGGGAGGVPDGSWRGHELELVRVQN